MKIKLLLEQCKCLPKDSQYLGSSWSKTRLGFRSKKKLYIGSQRCKQNQAKQLKWRNQILNFKQNTRQDQKRLQYLEWVFETLEFYGNIKLLTLREDDKKR
jgi:hypothetical protein